MNQLIITPAPNLVLEIVPQSGPVLTLLAPPSHSLTLATVGVQGPPGAAIADIDLGTFT